MLHHVIEEIQACQAELDRYCLGIGLSPIRDHVTSNYGGFMCFQFRTKAQIRVRGDQAFATFLNREFVYDQNSVADGYKEVMWMYMTNQGLWQEACGAIDNFHGERYFISARRLEYDRAAPHLGFRFTLTVNNIITTVERTGDQYLEIEPTNIMVRFVPK